MPASFAQLGAQKSDFIEAVLTSSPEQRAFRPAPEAWTAPQILDHLARTEAAICSIVTTNLSSPQRVSLRDKLGTLFLQRIFSSDRKVKVPPSASAILPDPEPELDAVLLRWAETRRLLADLLTGNNPEQHRGGVFRHPVAGWMTLGGVLDFFTVHMRHHRFQLDRLQQAYCSANITG